MTQIIRRKGKVEDLQDAIVILDRAQYEIWLERSADGFVDTISQQRVFHAMRYLRRQLSIALPPLSTGIE